MKILITGVAGDLGGQILTHLLAGGHDIIGIDIQPKFTANSDLSKKNYKFYQLDLSDLERLPGKMKKILKENERIDGFIHVAAVRHFKFFGQFSPPEVFETINVNYTSSLIIIQDLLSHLNARNTGRIVFISSFSAFRGYSSGSLYCSTKSALNIFSQSLAKDFKKQNLDLTANVICPDSFLSREGQKLPQYDFIVKSVLQKIDYILDSPVNGKIFRISSKLKKIKESAIYLKSMLKD